MNDLFFSVLREIEELRIMNDVEELHEKSKYLLYSIMHKTAIALQNDPPRSVSWNQAIMCAN